MVEVRRFAVKNTHFQHVATARCSDQNKKSSRAKTLSTRAFYKNLLLPVFSSFFVEVEQVTLNRHLKLAFQKFESFSIKKNLFCNLQETNGACQA